MSEDFPGKDADGSQAAARVISRFDEGLQVLRVSALAESSQGLGLDLSNALACHDKALTDLRESVLPLLAHAKAHAKHLRLAGLERRQELLGLLCQHGVHGALERRLRVFVFEHVSERRALIFSERGLQTQRMTHASHGGLDLRSADLERRRDFRDGRLAPKVLNEGLARPSDLTDELE